VKINAKNKERECKKEIYIISYERQRTMNCGLTSLNVFKRHNGTIAVEQQYAT